MKRIFSKCLYKFTKVCSPLKQPMRGISSQRIYKSPQSILPFKNNQLKESFLNGYRKFIQIYAALKQPMKSIMFFLKLWSLDLLPPGEIGLKNNAHFNDQLPFDLASSITNHWKWNSNVNLKSVLTFSIFSEGYRGYLALGLTSSVR